MKLLSIVLITALSAIAQTLPNAVPMPTPEIQYLNAAGQPLAGAYLCTFAAGTSTPLATYTSSTAGTPNTNPIVLDSAGRASVWIGPQLYKFVLYVGGTQACPSTGAVQWSQDNVTDTTLYFTNFVKTAGTSTIISYTAPNGGVQETVSAKLSQVLNVKDYGAVCNDTFSVAGNDDTAAIQTALNAVPSLGGAGFNTVQLPAGQCRITAPLIVGRYTNLRGMGNGSKLHCDFGSWVGTDYNCIRLMAVDAPPGNFTTYAGMFGRIFGDFSMYGTGNGGLISTGLYIGMNPALAPIQYSAIVNYAVLGTKVQNIYFEAFDTGLQLCESQLMTFDNIQSNHTRVGISVNGQTIQATFKFNLGNFYNHPEAVTAGITPFTSSTLPSQGFFLDYNQSNIAFAGRYLNPDMSVNVTGWPQGITIDNSLIDAADNDLDIQNVLQMVVTNSIFDLANKDCVIIGPPQFLNMENNFFFTFGENYADVVVFPVYIQDAFAHLIFRNNFFDHGNGVVSDSSSGIYFPDGGVGSFPWVDVQIVGNRFSGMANPITLISGPRYSIVSDNYGDQTLGVFAFWNNHGEHSFFDRNNTKDNYAILVVGAGIDPTFYTGLNHSPATDTTTVLGTPYSTVQIWRNTALSVANSSGSMALALGWADAIAAQIAPYKNSTTTSGIQLQIQQSGSTLPSLDSSAQALLIRSTVYGSADASGTENLYIGFKDHNGPLINAIKQSTTVAGLGFYVENPRNTPVAAAVVDGVKATWQFTQPAQVLPKTVSALTALITCAAGTEGFLAPVQDANSATFNAALAGGGANHVIGYCNGTAWVVH